MGPDGGADTATGLYVHWPFCVRRCPYCDFNAHARDAVNDGRWRRALLSELDHFAAETGKRTLASVFFGGGTPSLMDPATVAALIDAAADRWGLAADAEITLEANPGTVDAARFADFRAAGVNRLSIGVQSLREDGLRFLGRIHDLAAARAAIDAAARLFDRFSFDLIYARPGQDAAAWRAELADGLALAGDHLSLYQLSVEPGTPFAAAVARGEWAPPGEGEAAALYEITQELATAAGLPAYEISNHATPGGESRHNLNYWRGGDYIGVGPGAHGRLTGAHGRLTGDSGRRAIRQARTPEAWLAEVEANGHAVREDAPLSAAERIDELLMMGLRLTAGIEASLFRAAAGADIDDVLSEERRTALAEAGLIVRDNAGLRATAAGLLRLDAVLAYLRAGD
ncbi:MAG: radical SAM family heme chaperone HemW [Alphaproteobacteria bacterium]